MRVRHSGDRRRRWLVPEVVQTSAMDCGPAALAAMCAGFGLPASYGRLREACQTGVDGTSIDTIEDVANGLGLDAAQVMLPVDQLLDPDAAALPAIVVTRLPNGFTHFVVAWRRHGPLVQVMDPAVGRRFLSKRRFLADCHVHAMPVPADAWRQFASSESSLRILGRRLARLGVGDADRRVAHALADPGWRRLATLDAGVRAVTAVAGAGLRRGDHTGALVARLVDEGDRIAPPWWSATPAGRDPETGAERVLLRGAVLVQVEGRRTEPLPADGLVPELVAARTEEQPHPLRTLARMARAEPGGRARLVGLATGAVLVALGVVGQAALLRAVLDRLGSDRDHAPLVAALLVLAAALAAAELWAASVSLGLGRCLERRLRLSFAAKIPRLPDRYLHSRPTSDMAERSHSLHRLRVLTEMGGQAARSLATLVVTVVAVAWLDPSSAVPAAIAAIGAVAVPLAFQPALAERDLRLRTHQGALGQLVLDALLGVVPTRVHRARSAMLRAHGDLSVEWQRTAMSFQRTAAVADGVQGVAAAALVGWVLFAYVPRAGGAGHALLFVFLALTIPVSGQDAALALRRWPPLRTGVLRLLEPLGAAEEPAPAPGPGPDRPGGADLSLEHVTVVVGGHAVLQEVDLHVGPGEHVALVGASGAGKSTLLGLLLGWHRPAGGTVWVDGAALDGDQVERLRADSAWVDPAVQLWNRSLAANLRYGAAGEARPLDHVVAAAGLGPVVGNLPLGLDTPLGEGGGLVSGGEGQRVRFGRALGRPAARLVVLDEPFRGLDRPSRAALLEDARATWRHATLLCATHDVGETASFDRVLVLDGGRVVEDGRPADLAADAGSRYRGLLDAETAVRDLLFGAKGWRRLRLVGCRLHERDGAPV